MTKKKSNCLIKFIKNYLPDIIILVGIWVFSYSTFKPSRVEVIQMKISHPTPLLAVWEWKILAIILITIGLDMVIRKFVSHKKGNENLSVDELYDDAKKLVIDNNQASASFLQRKLKIGYVRAAQLIDMLEDDNIVGPTDGTNPRKLLKKY